MTNIALNPLERAVLAAFSAQDPRLASHLSGLIVREREFSGVGSFTSFLPAAQPVAVQDGPIGLDGLIEIPGTPNDLGASIHIMGGQVEFLEIVAFASGWDGAYHGFVVRRRA